MRLSTESEAIMSDIDVYCFTGWDQMEGNNLLSKRQATMEAIKVRSGTALPEARRFVDSSELDGNGFLKPDQPIR